MDGREAKEARLAELKASLGAVEGTPTEVYSRIVGYYRSVRNWNAGKREEFGKRREFSFPQAMAASAEACQEPSCGCGAGRTGGAVSSYILFSRRTCPNCPPVKAYLEASGVPGRIINVDDEAGLDLARRYDVLSTPTAVLVGAAGQELARAHATSQLASLLGREAKAVSA